MEMRRYGQIGEILFGARVFFQNVDSLKAACVNENQQYFTDVITLMPAIQTFNKRPGLFLPLNCCYVKQIIQKKLHSQKKPAFFRN